MCVCVCVCVCVQYVCVKCMYSVRLFGCVHTRVCVSCVCGLFFIGIIFFICFYLFFYVRIGTDILCIYVHAGRHEFILFFSFFFCLYISMCVLYLFFFFSSSVYSPLTSYLIQISCFEYVWIFLLLL